MGSKADDVRDTNKSIDDCEKAMRVPLRSVGFLERNPRREGRHLPGHEVDSMIDMGTP